MAFENVYKVSCDRLYGWYHKKVQHNAFWLSFFPSNVMGVESFISLSNKVTTLNRSYVPSDSSPNLPQVDGGWHRAKAQTRDYRQSRAHRTCILLCPIPNPSHPLLLKSSHTHTHTHTTYIHVQTLKALTPSRKRKSLGRQYPGDSLLL